jgi:membrane protease YdiL (CAAX protease family)
MKVVRFELLLDILWVVGSAWYVATAQSYPPDGRLIPTIVGGAALVVAIIQLAGNFFPVLRPFTHLKKEEDAQHSSGDPSHAAKTGESSNTRAKDKQQLIAIGWSIGFILAIYLIGFVFAVPLFFLAYFLTQKQRKWKTAIVSAVVMWALTWGLFEQLLSIHFPAGLLF